MKLLSPSVIRIVANGHLVKHEELKAMKEVFDRLDKTRSDRPSSPTTHPYI
jgi:hypothetical protein